MIQANTLAQTLAIIKIYLERRGKKKDNTENLITSWDES